MPAQSELMSDDDFLNNMGNGGITDESQKLETINTVLEDIITDIAAPNTPTDATVVDEKTTPPVDEKSSTDVVDETAKAAYNAAEVSSTGSTPETATDTPAATGDTSATESEKVVETPANYEELYKKIMAPFKANGKMIDLKDPAEAIQLMQMGANYTRKLQELQPQRKLMLMLQNNGLLDEEKLSFLIDLDKRNPEAIKKLVKEAGIDPLDIDTSKEPTYQTGNHKVTDAEANFRSVLDEIGSTQDGKVTLQAINDGWDQASKEVLWKQPELITTMHNQREAGVYQIVVDEIHRQRVLGTLPPNTPFIEAYRIVGDRLLETDAFDHLPAIKQLKPERAPVVVATRTASTKPAVVNGDKASAASPSRSTPRTATTVNPLSMSDEEFLKQMENRL